jgi:hypothetical protein
LTHERQPGMLPCTARPVCVCSTRASSLTSSPLSLRCELASQLPAHPPARPPACLPAMQLRCMHVQALTPSISQRNPSFHASLSPSAPAAVTARSTCRARLSEPRWMASTSASSAPVAPPPAPPTGACGYFTAPWSSRAVPVFNAAAPACLPLPLLLTMPGGTGTSTWASRRCCMSTAGWWTAATALAGSASATLATPSSACLPHPACG